MDAQAFWNVIGSYNQSSWVCQCAVLALIAAGAVLAFSQKAAGFLKAALGLGNLFIGVVFFLVFGTEPIQRYAAAPLFLAIGGLFLYEAVRRKTDCFRTPGVIQWALLFLFAVYPLISVLLGHSFPQMVVHVMPCPMVSLSIVLYSCYEQKSKPLLLFMTLWGLTGIKAFFVNALEDTILLLCGLFCLWLFIKQCVAGRKRA
jgi:hypothetical protein